jgi:hypothetical protein
LLPQDAGPTASTRPSQWSGREVTSARCENAPCSGGVTHPRSEGNPELLATVQSGKKWVVEGPLAQDRSARPGATARLVAGSLAICGGNSRSGP